MTFLSYVTGSVHTLCQEQITRFKNDNSSYRKSEIADKLFIQHDTTLTHSCVDVSNNRFKRQDVTECIVPSFRDIPCISQDYSFCLSPNFHRFVCFMFRHIGIWFVSIRQSDIIFSGLHLDVRKFGATELSSKTMNIFSSQNFQSSIGDRQCFFTTTTGHQDFDRLHILCIL